MAFGFGEYNDENIITTSISNPSNPVITKFSEYTSKEYRAFLGDDLIRFGDDKEPEFKPKLELSRWNGEAKLRVWFDESAIVDKSHNLDIDDKVKWETPLQDIHVYTLDPTEQYEHGGIEYDLILKSKPTTNIITLQIESENLEFLYQPLTLSPEEIALGAERPENVAGSYAVYHISKKDNEYKTGKAFHIYRPRAVDADGWEVWGTLDIDSEKGLMTITLPQDFIDKARYPIRHSSGATFGYTSIGALNTGLGQSGLVSLRAQLTENGCITKITAYCTDSSTDNMKCALYSDKAGPSPDALQGGTGETSVGVAAWYDFTYGTSLYKTAAWYWITIFLHDTQSKIYYDAGGADGCWITVAYDGFPDPYGAETGSDNRFSIYATYDAGYCTSTTTTTMTSSTTTGSSTTQTSTTSSSTSSSTTSSSTTTVTSSTSTTSSTTSSTSSSSTSTSSSTTVTSSTSTSTTSSSTTVTSSTTTRTSSTSTSSTTTTLTPPPRAVGGRLARRPVMERLYLNIPVEGRILSERELWTEITGSIEQSLETTFQMEGNIEMTLEKVSKIKGLNRSHLERLLEMLRDEQTQH